MRDLERILELMFNPEDTVCPSIGQWAFYSHPISEILSGQITLVSPNPKTFPQKVKSEDLILLAVNPILGFRNDENVYRYQNFIFEIDTGEIADQISYIKKLGLPYSAIIFSGNKSAHILCALDKEVPEKVWRWMYEWTLNIATFLDKNCKTPSRSIRIPGAIRPDTGKTQDLLEITGKVKLTDFINWLNKHQSSKPINREKRNLTDSKEPASISTWAKRQFKNGIDFSKGRNTAYFQLACDLARAGNTEEGVIEILSQYYQEESDFKEKEFLSAIRQGFKQVDQEDCD